MLQLVSQWWRNQLVALQSSRVKGTAPLQLTLPVWTHLSKKSTPLCSRT